MSHTYAPADAAAVASYATALKAQLHLEKTALVAAGARLVSPEWLMRNVVVGLHEYGATGRVDLAQPGAHIGHLAYTAGRHSWPRGWCTRPDSHDRQAVAE